VIKRGGTDAVDTQRPKGGKAKGKSYGKEGKNFTWMKKRYSFLGRIELGNSKHSTEEGPGSRRRGERKHCIFKWNLHKKTRTITLTS